MFCEQCGTKLSENARFCQRCGARVRPGDASAAAAAPAPTTELAPTPPGPDPAGPPVADERAPEAIPAAAETAPERPAQDATEAIPSSSTRGGSSPPPAPASPTPPPWAVTATVSRQRVTPPANEREETILAPTELPHELTEEEIRARSAGLPIVGMRLTGPFRRFLGIVFDVGFLFVLIGLILIVGFNSGDNTPHNVLAVLILILYFPLGYSGGRTVGTWATYSRIVRASDGQRPGLARGIIRSLVLPISALALLVGFFWAIWDKQRQTWHDKAAGTLVSDARVVPAADQFEPADPGSREYATARG